MGPGTAPPAPDQSRVSLPPRRPLLGLAALFLTGILIGLARPALAAPALAAAAASLGLAVCRPRAAGVCLMAATLALGAARAGQWVRPPARPTLDQVMARPAESLTVRGMISRDPAWTPDYAPNRLPLSSGRWRMVLHLEAVDRIGEFQPVGGRLICTWETDGQSPRPRYGQVWEFYGVARTDRDGGGLQALGAPATLRVTDATPRLVASGRGHRWVETSLRGREVFARILEQGMTDFPDQAAVLKALLLGYRSELPPAWEERFSRTGTLHIFAISGLHVGVMALLVVGLLRALGLPREHWVLIVIPVLVLYTLGTGMKASAVRACVMAVAYWSATLVRRRPDAPSALALAAILIAAVEPGQVLSMGFVLSFSVVTGILVLVPILQEPVQNRLRPEPWLAAPERGSVRLGRWTASWVASLAVLSLACWAVSFPLTARFFHVLSPIGLAGNLAVVPGAFLIVLTGCLSLVGGSVSPFLAEVFNHANRVFVSGLLQVIEAMDAVPGGWRYVPKVGWAWIAAWYAMLLAWVRLPAGRRFGWGVALVSLAAVWVAVYPIRIGLRCTALDADGCVSLLAEAGNRHRTLIDAGPAFRGRDLVDSLRNLGVNRVDRLILSSCEPARNGAAPALLAAVRVGEVCLAGGERDEPALLDTILREAALRAIPVRRLPTGHQGFLPDGTEWEVLAPSEPAGNIDPLVLRFARDGLAVLWMGGGGTIAEYRLSQAGLYPRADVLVLSSPHRSDPLYSPWIQDVAPTAVIYSPRGFQTRSDNPDTWLQPLHDLQIPAWTTDRDSALTLKTKGPHSWTTEVIPFGR